MRYCLLIISFFATITYAFSQGITIPGQVTDTKNNPVSQVTISVVGANSTAITDELGIFSLKLSKSIKKGDEITIRASKSGYKTVSRHIAVSSLMIPIRLIKIKTVNNNLTNSVDRKVDSINKNKPENNSGVIVQSFGQKGGITAGTVIVPEDKEIPLTDNYTIKSVTLNNNQKAILISPKHGTWIQPYVGYLSEEKAINNINIDMTVMNSGESNRQIILSGKKYDFYIETWQIPQIIPSLPIRLTYQILPSKIVFGDFSDTTKQYIISGK